MFSNKFITNNNSYQPEIDGLRAFAIISVIVNHFNKDFLPGGYLGIDIFFVISGYVITSSLSRRKDKNFSKFILSFYERRIKRLLPSLIIFVLIISLLTLFFNSNPKLNLYTGLSSLFGLSNLFLYRQRLDYFAISSDLNVFTHTWSLGVEEQFYMFFPFLIWFSGVFRYKKGLRNFLIIISTMAIFSLLSFIYQYSTNHSAAYFLMHNRFWEIAFGSILFFLVNVKLQFYENYKKISPNIIIISIISILFLPLKYAVFSTISVVFLTGLLILFLDKSTFLFKLFSNKFIVYIGLLSYSLYLWHWGILSISRWTIGIHWWSIPFQILIIFFVSKLSYDLIESPLRKKLWITKNPDLIVKLFSLSAISGFTLIAFAGFFKVNLFLGRKELNQQQSPFFKDLKINKDYCFFNDSLETNQTKEIIFKNCLVKYSPESSTMFFIGDSHMRSMWSGAEYIVKKTGSNFFTYTSASTLFPVVNYFRTDNKRVFFERNKVMSSVENEILTRAKANDLVFIALRLPYHFDKNHYEFPVYRFRFFDSENKVIKRNNKEKHFEDWLISLENFTKEIGNKNVNVIVFMPTPEFPFAVTKRCYEQNMQWFNKTNKKSCNYPLDFFIKEKGKYNILIEKIQDKANNLDNLYLFNSLKYICPEDMCRYSFKGKLLFKDDDHISNFTARELFAPQLVDFIRKNKLLEEI